MLWFRYRPDWTDDSTHCVAAIAHTPKYNQVLSKGGIIVTREWVFDSQRLGERMEEKRWLGIYISLSLSLTLSLSLYFFIIILCLSVVLSLSLSLSLV